MATFLRNSVVWIIDWRFDGRPRRWYRVVPVGQDLLRQVDAELRDSHGERARLVAVRPATPEEEAQYLRGEEPRNAYCPTGRRVEPLPEPVEP